MLRDRARAHGAEVRHGVMVEAIEIDTDGVVVRSSAGTERARYVIDATGQDRFVAKRRRSVRPYRHFGKAASFTHFEGIRSEAFDEIGPGNDIRVMMVPDGWAWVIPLAGDRLSIGLVHKRPGIRANDVVDYVASSPMLSRWTAGAKPRATQLLGNFSYKNAEPFGPRYACVGDAACFIDPVFSSGVSLAIASAESLVQRLSPALHEGRESDPGLMTSFATYMERGYDTFASLVYRFYNTAFVDNMIFGAPSEGDLRASVVSVLGGDVFRPDNRFRDMLLRGREQPWRRDQIAEGEGDIPDFEVAGETRGVV
jgi:flavin-dependent dehydrogenase